MPPEVEKSQTSPELLVHPGEPLGRERRAGRADCLELREVPALGGAEAGLLAVGDVGRPDPEAGDARLLGQVPEDAEVGSAGVAVVEHDRRVRGECADDEVPHHPARRREPEEPVVGLQVEVQVHLLQHLEQDAAVAVHDRLRQTGRARAVEDPERVVERHLLEGELSALTRGAEVVPADRAPEASEGGSGSR